MVVSRILVTVAIAAFASAVVANGLDRVSKGNPGAARLVPKPFRAQANRSAATTELVRADNAAALASASAAVATDPVDPDSTSLLGAALSQVGRAADAERTFRVAAKFGWRNVATQAYWYQAALQTGEYDVAANRLDALLRAHPRLIEQAQLLQPLESDPAGRKILAEHLQLQPPWLAAYLHVADDTPSDVLDRRFAVLSEIDSTHFPIGCKAVAPFTRTLLDSGRRRDAENLWNRNCPSLKVAGLIADPTFSKVLADSDSNNPFSWQVMSSGDLSVREIGGSGGARSLLLSNSAPGTRLTLLQTVAFPPGVYRFHASQLADGPTTAGKVYLSWACNGKPPFPDASAGDLVSGQVIHVGNCDRQEIGLWLGGGGTSVRLQAIAFEKID